MEDLGELEAAGDQWRIRFTRMLAHPPERVWRAITEPAHLAVWFPDEVIGEIAPGATLQFFDANSGSFDGKVIAMDPPRLLELVWGDDTLRFELREEGDGTVLVFTDTIGELGKAARDTAGWHFCLDNLEADLRGAPRAEMTEWKPLNDAYVERFGPDASAIGPPSSHPVND